MKKHRLAYKKYNLVMKDDYARYLLICALSGGGFGIMKRKEFEQYEWDRGWNWDAYYDDDQLPCGCCSCCGCTCDGYDDYEEWFDAGEQEEETE